MDKIDTAKRKPRRTIGTPSYYYRNRFATAVIVVGCAVFGILFIFPPVRQANKEILEYFTKRNIEDEERAALFGFLPPRRGEEILKILKESEDLDKER